MISIWQAFAYAFLAGGIGTIIGVWVGMALMSALAMAGDADRRMGLK
jgi:hypothetical protein